MNLKRFFIGISATFLVSVFVFLVIPFLTLTALEPVENQDMGIFVPVPTSGMAEAGQQHYVDHGCVYCHTQVITEPTFQPDLERGWGPRITVPLDYYYSTESLIGLRRFGPDLAFAGWEPRGLTQDYLLRLLYDPRIDNPRSVKPSYRFLFREEKIQGPIPNDALNIPADSTFAPREGYVIIPKREAKELVAYILSLNPNYPLPGAPLIATGEEEAIEEGEAEAPAEGEGETQVEAEGEGEAAATTETETDTPAAEEGADQPAAEADSEAATSAEENSPAAE
jgi:cytochrome c oxidase cbb3-type subunit 2